MAKPTKALEKSAQIELEPADPFELIRWLARSQPDPRKAVAELVQNSLDAGAENITLERSRMGSGVVLKIRDDGEGVLPKMARTEALRYLASNIGHSHKMSLDPGERARRVVAGQYGVGLLGFWSIGHRMEIHSRVSGGNIAVLRMLEDSPAAEVGTYPAPKGTSKTFTEVVISEVHATARRVLSGRRLAAYLATELRGQLTRSGANLVIEDRLARGDGRHVQVVPHRFTGERLELPTELAVPGYRPARVELYLTRGDAGASIELSCAGTRVVDDIATLDVLGLDQSPWTGSELSGVIDFPDFTIPPGTRRGVAPNDAALAFLEALGGMTPKVLAELARLDTLHRAELDRQVVKELRNALRGFDDRVRDLSLPEIATDEDGEASGETVPPGMPLEEDGGGDASESEQEPPGPLHAVSVRPAFARISPGATRSVRARARDEEGRPIRRASFEWRLPDAEDAGLSIETHGARAVLTADEDAPIGKQVALMVVATLGDETVADIAAVEIVEDKHEVYSKLGIPEPVLVSAPAASWRSRLRGFAWEINEAHPDYIRVKEHGRRRLRYLIALLAKEIVIGSSRRDDVAELLESMVQVIAHAESNLR
ncbi:MAG: ATP-binding protein [Myxococcales bacterium]|nr:ATP-binding protein [Myxococcales bacterium]MCB9583124.1 ATP-binding protein [Polyangiaceae bacterium]